MDQNIKKNHPPAFKEKVAIEAIKEVETPGQLASKFSVHPIQVGVWKKAALSAVHEFFVTGNTVKKDKTEKEDELEQLYTKIGKLEVENDFLKKKVGILA
jgi:transposase-like protein